MSSAYERAHCMLRTATFPLTTICMLAAIAVCSILVTIPKQRELSPRAMITKRRKWGGMVQSLFPDLCLTPPFSQSPAGNKEKHIQERKQSTGTMILRGGGGGEGGGAREGPAIVVGGNKGIKDNLNNYHSDYNMMAVMMRTFQLRLLRGGYYSDNGGDHASEHHLGSRDDNDDDDDDDGEGEQEEIEENDEEGENGSICSNNKDTSTYHHPSLKSTLVVDQLTGQRYRRVRYSGMSDPFNLKRWEYDEELQDGEDHSSVRFTEDDIARAKESVSYYISANRSECAGNIAYFERQFGPIQPPPPHPPPPVVAVAAAAVGCPNTDYYYNKKNKKNRNRVFDQQQQQDYAAASIRRRRDDALAPHYSTPTTHQKATVEEGKQHNLNNENNQNEGSSAFRTLMLEELQEISEQLQQLGFDKNEFGVNFLPAPTNLVGRDDLVATSRGYKDGSSAMFDSPFGIAVSPSNEYIVADSFNRRIRVLSPGGIARTLAGDGREIAIDGMGTRASFRSPNGICCSPSGDIYVADTWAHRIRKISPMGETTTIAGSLGLASHGDGLGVWPSSSSSSSSSSSTPSSQFEEEEEKNLLVPEFKGNQGRIRATSLQPIEQQFHRLSLNKQEGYTEGRGMIGPITAPSLELARFHAPFDVAWDHRESGCVIVADTGNRAIRRIILAKNMVETLYKAPDEYTPGDDEIAFGKKQEERRQREKKESTKGRPPRLHPDEETDVEEAAVAQAYKDAEIKHNSEDDEMMPFPHFVFPQCLCISHRIQGWDIYISDSLSHRIYRLDEDGKLSVLAGGVYGRRDGFATKARFNRPSGIAAAQDGHIYVVDIGSFSYRRIDPLGFVSTLGDLGRTTTTDIYRGAKNLNQFFAPCAIALAKKDRLLLLCDPYNHEIRTSRLPKLRTDIEINED